MEMNRSHPIYDGHATTSLPQSPNRQRSCQYEDEIGSVFAYDRYTIAWICALHIEMAAARAMLDHIHDHPPRWANDNNSYILGSIMRHNIVIACLPEAQYGTTNAANVLTNLTRTFPAIRQGLMVGIGGGVPSRTDIRLGDIVVGTRVMQYDLVKVVGDGKVRRTAVPKIPDYSLRTGVTSLRAKHELEPSRVPYILRERMGSHADYGRPRTPDLLFRATYPHNSLLTNCDKCDELKLILRSTRTSDDPTIHYGAIASGNQVMRDAITRDDVARELGIICFEMETAGLMDIIPCLPIRGICDYSDSHKAKDWQRYAAATAAAYAREFLEAFPAQVQVIDPNYMLSSEPSELAKRRQRLLESLRFEKMGFRKATIKDSDAKTCRWFLRHPDYLSWLDPKRRSQHHGLLWISGKPGAGKSTIMKFIYKTLKNNDSQRKVLTASFFFNARGESLEKSISGMYRSLLLQLLEGFPCLDLQNAFHGSDFIPHSHAICPPLNALKDLLRHAIFALGKRFFTCVIDALDECDEQQVMDMVNYFEDLTENCTKNDISLKICFSSRHYPYIDIRLGIRLTLEDQEGHAGDLENYITSHLRIGNPSVMDKVLPRILKKASGVFLWVILVVDILNKEVRHGGLALQKRLEQTPSGLSELFKDLLGRDAEDMEALLLSILLILLAKRPLRPEEYYHAIWSGLALQGLADSDVPDHGYWDRVEKCVTSSSKGLAEITKSERPTVQFIHQSVRDFLVKDKGLHDLWPDLASDWEAFGHEKLKQCCNSYINYPLLPSIQISPVDLNDVKKKYPFLRYSSEYVLLHANSAADTIPQHEFLNKFSVSRWIVIENGFYFSLHGTPKYSSDESLLYLVAKMGLCALIRIQAKDYPQIDFRNEHYEHLLLAAIENKDMASVIALLDLPSNVVDGFDITANLTWTEGTMGSNYTPLTWASQEGHRYLVSLLLEKGAPVNQVDREGLTPLVRASSRRRLDVVVLLVEKGAKIKVKEGYQNTVSLSLLACYQDYEAAIKILNENGVNVYTADPEGIPILQLAASAGYETIARFLIEKGADVNKADVLQGNTALMRASADGHVAVARLLIEKRANINTTNHSGNTALHEATGRGHLEIARLLVTAKGVDINVHSEFGFSSTRGLTSAPVTALVEHLCRERY
ncbi:hypothetical protein BGZ63DRAFT_238265 [Mariannaea sp. PMI_226]|nr:hypothetical protein BGZ63DRAFT_238265 [Mariannaea sp. PMI_226]